MFLVGILSIAAAAYAHYALASHISKTSHLWFARLLLIAVGIGFGWVMSTVYLQLEDSAAAWIFISAFGSVHVPAAIILWLKKQRRKQLK